MNNSEQLAIWRRLTPRQRDYDRFVARKIPEGASWMAETEVGEQWKEAAMNELFHEECTCHVSAPCWFCVNQSDVEVES